jgi:predicted XRE-type DNA-binding protein
MAKLRHKMMKTMNKLVEKNNFKDKEIKFLG